MFYKNINYTFHTIIIKSQHTLHGSPPPPLPPTMLPHKSLATCEECASWTCEKCASCMWACEEWGGGRYSSIKEHGQCRQGTRHSVPSTAGIRCIRWWASKCIAVNFKVHTIYTPLYQCSLVGHCMDIDPVLCGHNFSLVAPYLTAAYNLGHYTIPRCWVKILNSEVDSW